MIIYRHKNKYTISEMCRFFEVSRSGYYDYVKRIDKPEKDLELAEKIKECQELNGKTYGYRRVHIWLERNGIHRNPKTVLRVMQKYNLLSKTRRRKYHHHSEVLHKYANILNRNFEADRPNQKWVTDISYIKTEQGTLYLSIIRDLYDNSIVAYKTGTEQNTTLVLNTIKAAKRKEKVTAELQLHSDQGFQYTSQAYFNLTQSYGITPSMSRRGNPYDNAVCESFFHTLKKEAIYHYLYKDPQELDAVVREYMHFYNEERPHRKLKMKTPLQFETEFFKRA